MAADLERLAREFRGDGFKNLRASIMAHAGIARQLGAPEHFPDSSKPQERRVSEQLTRERFADEEKEALERDGAKIYLLTGLTIPAQREAQERKGKPSFRYVVEGGGRLLTLPSRKTEVAIYPDPQRFFVPGSWGKNLREQEKLVAQDTEALKERLDLRNITQIIPEEAATLTELVFQHLDATGVWLFGPEYAAAEGLNFVYGRTKNPIKKTDSLVAGVGGAGSAGGLVVRGWDRDIGDRLFVVARLVVPIENR